MPTTWAFPPAKRCWSAFSAGASRFQVLENANAKNASTTRWPRYADNVISRPSCERREKSGAMSPTFRVVVSLAIFVRPFRGSGDTHLD
jgi:hypothetical protein